MNTSEDFEAEMPGGGIARGQVSRPAGYRTVRKTETVEMGDGRTAVVVSLHRERVPSGAAPGGADAS